MQNINVSNQFFRHHRNKKIIQAINVNQLLIRLNTSISKQHYKIIDPKSRPCLNCLSKLVTTLMQCLNFFRMLAQRTKKLQTSPTCKDCDNFTKSRWTTSLLSSSTCSEITLAFISITSCSDLLCYSNPQSKVTAQHCYIQLPHC